MVRVGVGVREKGGRRYRNRGAVGGSSQVDWLRGGAWVGLLVDLWVLLWAHVRQRTGKLFREEDSNSSGVHHSTTIPDTLL